MADMYKDLVKAVKKHSGLDDAEIIQAAEHGADAGWAGFTYTTDTVEFYDKNEELIWKLLEEMSSDMGSKNVMDFIGSFKIADQITDLDSFKNALSWFALEEAGQSLIRDREETEER